MRAVAALAAISLCSCAIQTGQQTFHPNGQLASTKYLAADMGRDAAATTTGSAYTQSYGQNQSEAFKHGVNGAVTYGAAAILGDVAKAESADAASVDKAQLSAETTQQAASQATARDAASQATTRALAP